MPNLHHRLHTHDYGFLKIVADLWGLELDAPDAHTALPQLTRAILSPQTVHEIVDALPGDARQALDTLIRHEGWLPWHRFTRTFGALREMGPGRRDREKPYLDPTSPTESLWYRGLIGRDFLQREGKLQECAYIPDDLLELLPPAAPEGAAPLGRAASPAETAHIIPATDRVLDHACTLLAALRLGDPLRAPAHHTWQPPLAVVNALLGANKLITSSQQPVAEDARPFLEMPRGKALAWLVQGWRGSPLFNELRLIPGLVCEGAWHNDPLLPRELILDLLGTIPEGTWWNLDSFVQFIFNHAPDFQRPTGDFDTWLIRDAASGDSLAGMAHWNAVDGALVRYLICGPMHWLGLTDLASPTEGSLPAAFRLSSWASNLLLGKPVEGLSLEDQPLEVFSDGKIVASPVTPRIVRYQVSRFCLWQAESPAAYTYQLTPQSLSKAAEQGLKISHLVTLLNSKAEALPPSLSEALLHWEQNGGQVRVHPGVILQVESPRILQALRDSPARRFISDPLGPTAALIEAGAVEKVTAALARLGYLSDIERLDEDARVDDQDL